MLIHLIEIGLILIYSQFLLILNHTNILLILISIEIILLGIVLVFSQLSYILDDSTGALISLLLLPLAGAESAIGLMIAIRYYTERGTIQI